MTGIETICRELNTTAARVQAVADLLASGATIPFIARYRKELTDSMDEVMITAIRDRITALSALEKRKDTILASLKNRELLTPELSLQIAASETLSRLEDLYEPYRPKKRTRAMAAKEKGLEPLAQFLLKQTRDDPEKAAEPYLAAAGSVEAALAGARDILAEAVNENIQIRDAVRKLFFKTARIRSVVKKGKTDDALTYKDYFDWDENAFKAPSHRIHAMFRGRNAALLSVHVLPDEQTALGLIERVYLKNRTLAAQQVKMAIKDSYKRLLSRSIEKECMDALKDRADQTAISVFAQNLNALLLYPPLGQKRILAIDPGFRSGCKMVCLDAQGQLLCHDLVFPFQADGSKAAQVILDRVKRHGIQAVGVGNGTAGRETQAFVQSIGLDRQIPIVMVDESGASIYSASECAREEFPDHDLTVRGAVSIGRRLMDPLAELVRLDPKSIGVGQYQHDVDHNRLTAALDDVVVSCVNQVGVEANTASRQLLGRVSGLSDAIAAEMVRFRESNGPFRSRREFLKVPRLGPKTFEQAAGFLRIHGAENPLDNSGIHPESYDIVSAMAKDCGCSVDALIKDQNRLSRIDVKRYITESVGMPTLRDMIAELANPGRDPRSAFVPFSFDETIHEITDLVPGMQVPGIVTNVTAFGAFVDIGVHQDGLVHISQMADRFVKDPARIVKVKDTVLVTVLEVDVRRRRISLSMKTRQDVSG